MFEWKSTIIRASLVAQRLKRLPPMWKTRVKSLDREDPLEKEMVTHSSIRSWEIPWTEKPGKLQSTGSQRVGHDWVTELNWKWKWSCCGVQLFATPWTVAHQAPPSMGFSRQEYWSWLPFPSPGDLPDPGIKPRSPALQADALTSEPPGISHLTWPWINSWLFTQTYFSRVP